MKYTAVATCGFGLESVLAFELKRLGVENIKTSDGRITFDASGDDIARANIWLRTAERVLIILAEYPAPTFDALFDGARAVPWGEVIDRADAFPVKGYSMNSALTSVPACQSVVKKALVERLKQDYKTEFLPENDRVTKRVRFSIVKDVCTLMLDTSGDGLHKRGYRPLMNEAPIKETLAAGICDFARVFPDSAVCDPFCGSGTLVIEAALRARGIAPGLRRAFAGEQYGFLGAGAFDRAREQARAEMHADVPFAGRGSDIDPAAVALAADNAKRAGVADCVRFEVADARRTVFSPNETVMANPPYGERLMDEKEAAALYAAFGENIFAQRCRGLYVISSHPEFERCIGRKAVRRRKLYNGMLPCQLFMYF
ncbi:MAG: class I SAM-dependent RNA methyltransferase [Oscillospiraceae bacterium]|nr:class I SAM-dependent RNA methyltransferase [Oscillospiraceae bacterium]